MKKLVYVLSFLFFFNVSKAQIFVGAAFGTYNVPGMSTGPFKGFSPVLKLAYMPKGPVGDQFFLNASVYTKNVNNGTENVYDGGGTLLGAATSEIAYHMRHLHLGFTKVLGSRDNEYEVPKFFTGAGASILQVKNVYTYEINGIKKTPEINTRWLYGFHFNAGVQYKVNPFLIQLQGNFDFMLAQIERDATEEAGYFVFGTKLGVLIPISKARENKKVNTKAKSRKN